MLRRLSLALLALGLTTLAAPAASGQTGISQKVAVCNPSYPTQCAKPDNTGALPITGSITASAGAKATAAAPSYVEGTTNPLSVDLSGNLRTTGASGTSAVNITQIGGNAVTTTVPVSGTVAATQSGTWNISNVSGTVSLPTGASTAALQGVQGTGLNPPTGGSGEIGFLSGIYNQVISTSAQAVAPQAQTTGGCTPGVALSAASNNSTLISTGAHTLCKLVLINTTSTIYYVRTYDSSSAPTCSSSTGATAMYPVPAQTTGAGIAVPIGPFGEAYASGLGFCITGASGLNDNTNAATGVTLNYSYK